MRNTTHVQHPETSGGHDYYHLTEDLADDAIAWLERHRAFRSGQPFLMYFATGAAHAPHQVPQEWVEKYRGQFDDGWDALRQRTFERARDLGWIPRDAQLTPRPESMPSWESVPPEEREFQSRLMEVFAGFVEHTDSQVGRVIDSLDRLGYADDTIVFYIWGDNGASAEGQLGSVAEMLALNTIVSPISQHIAAVERLGGLSELGGPRTDNHYNAGWAWAGGAPYRSTKLVAAHFGGTRNPMAIRWPGTIAPDSRPRPQFSHVIDVVPTIYDVLGITPPRIVNGFEQEPFDGTSFADTFANAGAPEHRNTQYFEIMGSRAIYHDGWIASSFGPRTPWVQGAPSVANWDPSKDRWELYDLRSDWSQAVDLAERDPERLEAMKELFLVEAARNNVLPVGGGLWIALHPEYRVGSPATQWTFGPSINRMPEFTAPRIGTIPNIVAIDADVPESADGVLYSLGAYTGGVSCYVVDGVLHYEYSYFLLDRTIIKGTAPLPVGRCTIEVETTPAEPPFRFGCAMRVTLRVNGVEVARGTVPATALFGFTANDSFDVGMDNGTPVSDAYFHDAPARFNGSINEVTVRYLP